MQKRDYEELNLDKSEEIDLPANKKIRVVQHQKGQFNVFHYLTISNKYILSQIKVIQELLCKYYKNIEKNLKLDFEEDCHLSVFETVYIHFDTINLLKKHFFELQNTRETPQIYTLDLSKQTFYENKSKTRFFIAIKVKDEYQPNLKMIFDNVTAYMHKFNLKNTIAFTCWY